MSTLTLKQVHKVLRNIRRHVEDVQSCLLEERKYGVPGTFLFKYIGVLQPTEEEEEEEEERHGEDGIMSTKVLACFDISEYFCFKQNKRVAMEPPSELVVLVSFNFKGGAQHGVWARQMQTLALTPNGFIEYSDLRTKQINNICIQEMSSFYQKKTFSTKNLTVSDMLGSLVVFLTSRESENIHIGRYRGDTDPVTFANESRGYNEKMEVFHRVFAPFLAQGKDGIHKQLKVARKAAKSMHTLHLRDKRILKHVWAAWAGAVVAPVECGRTVVASFEPTLTKYTDRNMRPWVRFRNGAKRYTSVALVKQYPYFAGDNLFYRCVYDHELYFTSDLRNCIDPETQHPLLFMVLCGFGIVEITYFKTTVQGAYTSKTVFRSVDKEDVSSFISRVRDRSVFVLPLVSDEFANAHVFARVYDPNGTKELHRIGRAAAHKIKQWYARKTHKKPHGFFHLLRKPAKDRTPPPQRPHFNSCLYKYGYLRMSTSRVITGMRVARHMVKYSSMWIKRLAKHIMDNKKSYIMVDPRGTILNLLVRYERRDDLFGTRFEKTTPTARAVLHALDNWPDGRKFIKRVFPMWWYTIEQDRSRQVTQYWKYVQCMSERMGVVCARVMSREMQRELKRQATQLRHVEHKPSATVVEGYVLHSTMRDAVLRLSFLVRNHILARACRRVLWAFATRDKLSSALFLLKTHHERVTMHAAVRKMYTRVVLYAHTRSFITQLSLDEKENELLYEMLAGKKKSVYSVMRNVGVSFMTQLLAYLLSVSYVCSDVENKVSGLIVVFRHFTGNHASLNESLCFYKELVGPQRGSECMERLLRTMTSHKRYNLKIVRGMTATTTACVVGESVHFKSENVTKIVALAEKVSRAYMRTHEQWVQEEVVGKRGCKDTRPLAAMAALAKTNTKHKKWPRGRRWRKKKKM